MLFILIHIYPKVTSNSTVLDSTFKNIHDKVIKYRTH